MNLMNYILIENASTGAPKNHPSIDVMEAQICDSLH
jgi:hypothetical protein